MSTRAIIARPNGDGFAGRYHHSNGYPTGLGRALYGHYHGYFAGDIARMLAVLVDEHTAGWSNIVDANFRYKPRWKEPYGCNYQSKHPSARHPVCFCHGDRHYEPNLYTDNDSTDCEWCYVINPRTRHMFILAHNGFEGGNYISGRDLWRLVYDVDLDGLEPDWELIKKKGELL